MRRIKNLLRTINRPGDVPDFSRVHAVVLGDIMLDEYTRGAVTRLSPEAPVPVVTRREHFFVLGGAANVAANMTALGAETTLVGVWGSDPARTILKGLLSERGIREKIVEVRDRPTTWKHRIVAGGQQILRVDEEATDALRPADEGRVARTVCSLVAHSDVVVFSDYAKGLFSPALTREVIRTAWRAKKPIIADVKPPNLPFFKGVTLIAPNLKEAQAMTGERDAAGAARALSASLRADVVVTEGAEGMTACSRGGECALIPAKKIFLCDVSGAGDTVTAVLALCYARGLPFFEAAALANTAGGIVVQKAGTAIVSREELLSAVSGNHRDVADVPEVSKVWGSEKWLENNDLYCSKVLSLKKGYQCSLHTHKVKDEMFLVIEGHVRLEVGDQTMHLHKGGFVRVFPGTSHRFRGVEDSTILEVSTHHDDGDSYRIEKSKKVES